MSLKENVRAALTWYRFHVWERIPRKFRTVINIVLGAALAAAVKEYLTGDATFDSVWDAVQAAVGVILVRMLNPGDGYGGIVAPEKPASTDLDPAAELGDTSPVSEG